MLNSDKNENSSKPLIDQLFDGDISYLEWEARQKEIQQALHDINKK